MIEHNTFRDCQHSTLIPLDLWTYLFIEPGPNHYALYSFGFTDLNFLLADDE